MDPNFKPLDICNFETQRLLGAFNAVAETEIACSEGIIKKGNKG